MIRNKYVLKTFAITCTLLTLNNLLFPSISYALTSGPTAPEATSFEPVDTTDMVNLNTGDFTYNVPLLEVPGPAGGYPLSLAYHAGIQPNEDASWVGLGWSLNPGAINRSVNGYADDHQGVTNVDRVFWEGEETKTYTVGLSVGIANGASVSAGLSFSQSTYRGFGVGGYVGAGVGFSGEGSPFSAGANGVVGISPYGDPYSSAGINLGVGTSEREGMNLGANVGFNVSSASGANVSAGTGVTWRGAANDQGHAAGGSFLGASIGTGGTKPSLSAGGGVAGVHNSKSGNISTYSSGFTQDIPVWPGINVRLGYQYQRYWIDETANVFTSGALYFPETKFTSSALDNRAFDTYNLLDVTGDVVDNPDPAKVLGGSFPDYDQYQVVAQGLSGNIRPYHFRKNLIQQNRKQGDTYSVKSLPMDQVDGSVAFRFVNDFSNRYLYQDYPFTLGYSFLFTNNKNKIYNRAGEGEAVTGEYGVDGIKDNHLAGSKHIEWYTNEQIIGEGTDIDPFTEGFIDQRATGFERENNSQIGGFMITNESGVTYHYALPVYSYDEYMKSENTEEFRKEKGDTYNELFKPEKYAYTWHLTAVTGPDFVDRNNNGLADDGDWGYWVDFQYGKWSDRYQWRNPSEGTNRDLDGEFENYSTGKKELYYLDAIRTASHTALFIKKIRNDGKGVISNEGGFNPSYNTDGNTTNCYYEFPTSVLGLKEIYMLKNEDVSLNDLQKLKKDGESYDYSFTYTCTLTACSESSNCSVPCCNKRDISYQETINLPHFGDNILDETDLKNDVLRAKTTRIINLETDYTLCQNTSNHFDNEKLYKASPKLIDSNEDGKLTLKKLHFLGKGGVSIMPPTTFNYGFNPSYKKDFYDMWGFYKSDYNLSLEEETNESVSRITTPTSALDVDAWSLTDITTPLGSAIHIDYGSDWYEKAALAERQMLRIKSVEKADQNKLKISFWEDVDVSEYFYTNGTIDTDIIGVYDIGHYDPVKHERQCSCTNIYYEKDIDNLYKYQKVNFVGEDATIVEVNVAEKNIVIEDRNLYTHITQDNYLWDVELASIETNCGNQYTCSYQISEKWPDYIVGGICTTPVRTRPGGGLRVEAISIYQNPLETDKRSSTTCYEYHNGTTSYEPFKVPFPIISPDYPDSEFHKNIESAKITYKKAVYKRYASVINIARELPGPGVMYESVTVREERKDDHGVEITLPNYTTYQFEVFREGMVGIDASPIRTDKTVDNHEGITYRQTHVREQKLLDYSSRVGSLKSITLFDAEGNVVSKTQNHYLHDNLDGSLEDNEENYRSLLSNYNLQGVIDESFTEARFVLYKNGDVIPYGENKGRTFDNQYHQLGTVSKRETYPVIQTGQTNTNFKTGITTSTENMAFDFYSGEVIQTLTTDSYNNRYLSIVQPAYRHYPKMGLKVYDSKNKNMLTQSTANSTYKLGSNDELDGLLAASIQTWSNQIDVLEEGIQPNIWRKKAAYRWNGSQSLEADGTYPQADFEKHPFNFQNPGNNLYWEKTGEITLYDPYSHALEAEDINGNYAATRMDEKHRLVLATATNAAYDEIAYSGAEGYVGNNRTEAGVERGDGLPSVAFAHTGKYSLKVSAGKQGFQYKIDESMLADLNKQYHASVWVYLPGKSETQDKMNQVQLYYTVDGVKRDNVFPLLQANKFKNWYLINLDIDGAGAEEVIIGCKNDTEYNVYFDDFRIHPLDAGMITYVYNNDTDELTYILDNNNIYTHYDYDAAGRLIRTSRERMNFDFGEGKKSFRADQILQETIYNYSKYY